MVAREWNGDHCRRSLSSNLILLVSTHLILQVTHSKGFEWNFSLEILKVIKI